MIGSDVMNIFMAFYYVLSAWFNIKISLEMRFIV